MTTPTKKKATPKRKSPSKAKTAPKAATASKTRKTSPKPATKPSVQKSTKAATSPTANDHTIKESHVLDDYQSFSEYISGVSDTSQELFGDYIQRQADLTLGKMDISADPLNVSTVFQAMAQSFSANPQKIMSLQNNLWESYAKLFDTMNRQMLGEDVEPVAKPAPNDKRFRHAEWSDNKAFDFIKQSYLIMSDWARNSVKSAEGMDKETQKRALFYTEQFLAAISPTNFPTTNPEVIEETIKTKGENLLKGYKNFIEDMERGDGELQMKQVDLDYFKVGVNVATTPGKVIFQNRLLQLIQYTPTTEKVAKRPLLIFPPWINKFYIMDLQPENSLIKWLVDQGRTVFVVSWVNPGPELKDMEFSDYMFEGVFEALNAIEKATGEKHVDAIGYCIGGTLLSIALAYMAKTKDDRIKTATFFTAQSDFSEAGELLMFVDDEQLKSMEAKMDAAGGVLPGAAMSQTFNMLRPNDLIWSVYVENYLKGKTAKRFDLLFWNSDATRMAKKVHLFYLREFYGKNILSRGKMKIKDITIDLSKVRIPIFMQAGEADHIAPAQSIYNSAKLYGGPVTYTLAGSGHIAGVINHPDKKKYHYSTNEDLPATLDAWKAGAQKHDFSWWPHWIKWLNKRSPGKVDARQPGTGKLKAIEDAPGSYVRVRSD